MLTWVSVLTKVVEPAGETIESRGRLRCLGRSSPSATSASALMSVWGHVQEGLGAAYRYSH
jgi:hypothetical protein